MQPIQKTTGQSTARKDFDFGEYTRRKPQAKRPGITAGLVAMAFALSMFIPVAGKADPAWLLYPGQLSAPVPPKAGAEVILVEANRRGPEDMRNPPWAKKREVPSVCALQIDGRKGGLSWYSEDCMKQHGLRKDLPRRCAVDARLFGNRDRVYPADCLRDAGFRLPKR